MDSRAADARAYWARRHPTDYSFVARSTTAPAVAVVRELLGGKAGTVCEFGCGIGLTLRAINATGDRELHEAAICHGYDINPEAVRVGNAAWGNTPEFRLRQGDVQVLAALPDDHYDVAFTVNALAHVVDVLETLRQLLRVSRSFFCLEPYDSARCGDDASEIFPHSWFWDYPALFAELDTEVEERPMPLGARGWDPYHHVYLVR